MVSEAVFEGEIPPEGVTELLGSLEELGTTGVLAFQSREGSGAVHLLHGQIAEPSPGASDERALEVLLSLRAGEFAVYPKLPHLPVTRGTDTTKRGSLSVHPPAELMRYCENAGLSGRLLLEHRGRLAIGYYEKGQLDEVSIDGGSADDFVDALQWAEGTFRVDSIPPPRDTLPPALQRISPQHATPQQPANPTKIFRPPTPDTASAATGTMAKVQPVNPDLPLVDAVEQGLAALGAAVAPVLEPHEDSSSASLAAPVSGLHPRASREQDETIRLVRRPGQDLPEDPRRIWHPVDYSPSAATESATTGSVKSKDDGRPMGFRRTLPWIGAVALLVFACLWVLAGMDPLE